MPETEVKIDELTRSGVEEQIGRAIVEAAESYLLAFISVARGSDTPSHQATLLEPQRERLFAAISAAMVAAKRLNNDKR